MCVSRNAAYVHPPVFVNIKNACLALFFWESNAAFIYHTRATSFMIAVMHVRMVEET